MLKKFNWGLLLVFLLSLLLNTIDLEINPIGLNQDESSNGYDAFSLGKTLKDHHGNFLPILLESYGDWASPVLTYITIFFVKIFGLSIFSIRLPVALLASFSVILFYLLTKKILINKAIALLGSLIYACNPIFLTFSRWAVPPSILPFFVLLTIYLVIKSLEKPKILSQEDTFKSKIPFILVGFFAGIWILAYPTQKLFVPLLALSIFLIYFKSEWKNMLYAGTTLVLVAIPQYLLTFSNPEKYNARFNNVASLSVSKENYLEGFCERYFEYFSPNFFFGEGDTQIIHHVMGIPAIYFLFSFFFYTGIILLIVQQFVKKKAVLQGTLAAIFPFSKKIGAVLLCYLLLFPIAASMTKDHYLSTRVYHSYPIVILVISYSIFILSAVCSKILHSNKSKTVVKAILYGIIAIYTTIQLFLFLGIYHDTYKEQSKHAFHYGVRQSMDYLLANEAKFDTIYLDKNLHVPDFLFFSKYDPLLLQKQKIPFNFNKFGKFYFKDVSPYFNSKIPNLFQEKSKGKIWSEVKILHPKTAVLLLYDAQD